MRVQILEASHNYNHVGTIIDIAHPTFKSKDTKSRSIILVACDTCSRIHEEESDDVEIINEVINDPKT